jgi:hypothetical protein
MSTHTSPLLAALAAVVLVACGGPTPEAAAPVAGGEHHGEHHGGGDGKGQGKGHEKGHHEGEHHGEMAPSVHALHEIIAPVWHMAPGPEQLAKTCEQHAAMADRTQKVAADATPEAAKADEAAWKAATDKAVKDVSALGAACATPDKAGVVDAFKVLHDDLHALMDKSKPR